MYCPEQARDPAPKEWCCRPVEGASWGGSKLESHRSGLNVFASGPKCSSEWFAACALIRIIVPFGMIAPSQSISAAALRGRLMDETV